MQYNPTMHKLSNGITVILDPMDVATDEICICFKTGSRDEEPHEYGLTHFCEHMLAGATPRFPTERAAKDYIADNGGHFNAVTGYDKLRFTGRIVAENLWTLLDFWAEHLQNALFDKDMIERERGVILEELRRALSNVGKKQLKFAEKHLYGIDAPGGTKNMGTPENIKSFTREQMLDFVSRRLSAKNCLICVSGKIENADELLKKIESRFSFLPTHDVAHTIRWQYHPCIAHNLMDELKTDNLEILFKYPWPDNIENKYKDFCFGKFERCLRERMTDTLRDKHGLVYSCGFTELYGDEYESFFGPYTETAPENIARVVALIAQTVYRVYTTDYPTADDLRKYKNQNMLSRANFLENNGARCDRNVSDWLYYNQAHDFYKMCELADAVTTDDIVKYTRGIFDGPMSILTHGPKFDCDLQQIWQDNFK